MDNNNIIILRHGKRICIYRIPSLIAIRMVCCVFVWVKESSNKATSIEISFFSIR